MKKLNNPFVIYGYKGPEYFCDREQETKTLLRALHNERNIVLISPRRIGKTGLIHHAFAEIARTDKDIHCFYMDVNATRNLTEFIHYFAKTVIGKVDNPTQAAYRKITAFFSAFKPTMSFDEMSGIPTFSITVAPNQQEESLKKIFDYLKLSEKRIYIAIDEFQQVAEYPEKGTEAILRSYIQFLPNVYFIFAGSKQHIMADMFLSAKRPFYQSAQIMNLPLIKEEKYLDFANRLFQPNHQNISEDVFHHLYASLDGQTWYLQVVLNRLYEMKETITSDTVDSTIEELVDEQDVAFNSYYESLTDNQAALLSAIAQEKSVSSVTSMEFISKYRLPAPSSISIALTALINREFVYKQDNTYIVYDRFFARWLRKKNARYE